MTGDGEPGGVSESETLGSGKVTGRTSEEIETDGEISDAYHARIEKELDIKPVGGRVPVPDTPAAREGTQKAEEKIEQLREDGKIPPAAEESGE